MRANDHLDVVALALVTWAALCAVDLSPLRYSTSSVLGTYLGCAVALFVVGTRSFRGWGETAALIGLLFTAGWLVAPCEFVLAASWCGLAWLSRSTSSQAVRVAKRVAGWLLGGGGVPALGGGSVLLAGLVLVLSLAGGFLGHMRREWLACALLLLGVAEPVFESRMHDAIAIDTPDGARLVVLTQYSPGVPSGVDRINAVLEQCASRGWRMSTSTEIGDAPAMGAIALFDPWTRIEDVDSDRILDYVRGGGRLLLFLGERGARSAQRILDEFGLSIGIPLGRGARSKWEGPMTGLPANPLFYSSRQIDGLALSDADVLASCFGRPVAATGHLGDGKWLLVADPALVLEKHIEPQRGGSHLGSLTLQYFLDVILERIE